MDYDVNSRQSILEHAKLLLDKSLKDLYPNSSVLNEGKGGLGQSVEKYHFNYNPNSDSAPDFEEAGVELKCTPLKMLKDGNMVSKERLVLNIIDYVKEGDKTFETSSFWKKNQFLLLLFYLYEKDKSYLELLFKLIRYWEFPETDLKIIRDDWNKIVKKIREGKAQEISEGDTLFLGACMKGSRSNDNLRTQFIENKPKAQQRAYSLKSVYLNSILQDSILDASISHALVMNDSYMEKLKNKLSKMASERSDVVKSINEYKNNETFEDLIIRKFSKYYGLTLSSIIERLDIEINLSSKQFLYDICKAILGVKTKHIGEFEKSGLSLKTINISSDGKLKESMSFRNIDFISIVEEDEWEKSFWYGEITKRFLFVVFRKDVSGDKCKNILEKIFFWNMPNKDIEESRFFWIDTRNKIKENNFEDFIRSTQHRICHVRPKGTKENNLAYTVNGELKKKKCYWLNRS